MGNSSARDVRAIRISDRDRRALDMRRNGASYDLIADRLGYGGRSHAAKAVKKQIKAVPAETARAVRELELQRLDRILRAIWGKAKRGDLLAIDRVLKIMDRRSAYLGLDAAKRSELSGPNAGAIDIHATSHDELMRRLDRLAAEARTRTDDSEPYPDAGGGTPILVESLG